MSEKALDRRIQGGSPQAPSRRRSVPAWVDWVVVLALGAYVVSGIDLVPFFGDESTYVWMSADFDAILEGRSGDIRYSRTPGEQRRRQQARLEQGAIDSISIGLARHALGMEVLEVKAKWDWKYSPDEVELMWEENLARKSLPGPALLRAARLPAALFTAGSLIWLYLFTRTLTGSRLASVAAVIVPGTQAVFLVHGRHAMLEGSKLFFIALSMLVAAAMLRRLQEGRTQRLLYLLLGASGGLALASKHDAGLQLAAIYLAAAATPFVQQLRGNSRSRHLLGLAGAACLTLGVFYAAMPVWWDWWPTMLLVASTAALLLLAPPWPARAGLRWAAVSVIAGAAAFHFTAVPELQTDPAAPVRLMLEARGAALGAAVEISEARDEALLRTGREKAGFLVAGLLDPEPRYWDSSGYEGRVLSEQIRRYEASWLDGRHRQSIIDAGLAVLGLVGLAWALRRHAATDVLLVLLLIVPALALELLLPVARQRYLLALHLPYATLTGMGIAEGWQRLSRAISQR